MKINIVDEKYYSKAENRIVLELQMNKKTDKFIRQYPIGKYFADFYVPDLNLVLEIDGFEFHSKEKDIEHDRTRNKFMNENGYTVVRATGKLAFRNPSGILNVLHLFPKKRTFFLESDSDIALIQKASMLMI